MMNKKSLSVLLFVSVLVNTFLLGVVISCYVMKPSHQPPPSPHGGSHLERFEIAKTILSVEGVAVVDRVLKDRGLRMRDDARALVPIRGDARDILTAPDFDAAALEALHQRMGVYDANIKRGVSQIIYDIAVELAPDERVKFFEHVLRGPPPGHRPPGGRGERRGPPHESNEG